MEDFKPKLEQKVDRLREPFWAFIGAQRTSSAFLILALVGALLVANSPYADLLDTLKLFSVGLVFGQAIFELSLLHLINDGLIAIFFSMRTKACRKTIFKMTDKHRTVSNPLNIIRRYAYGTSIYSARATGGFTPVRGDRRTR